MERERNTRARKLPLPAVASTNTLHECMVRRTRKSGQEDHRYCGIQKNAVSAYQGEGVRKQGDVLDGCWVGYKEPGSWRAGVSAVVECLT